MGYLSIFFIKHISVYSLFGIIPKYELYEIILRLGFLPPQKSSIGVRMHDIAILQENRISESDSDDGKFRLDPDRQQKT